MDARVRDAGASQVTRRFAGLALGFYVLAISLGLLLRFAFVRPMPWLDFQNALHAHSHTLYFGWAGLGLLALSFRHVGADGRGPRWVLGALAAVSAATFVAFLHSGYGVPGVAVSSAALFVWAGAVVLWFRSARGARGLPVAFMRVGMVYIALASVGAIGRVVLLVTKAGTPVHAQLGVFVFLHCFAWFFLFTTFGLLLAWLERRGVTVPARPVRAALWVMALTAWLGAPLGVAGADVGLMGAMARVGGGLVALAGVAWIAALWRAAAALDGAHRLAFRALVFWYAAKVAMEACGAFGLSSWAAQARQPVILYLHVLLVGFVSLGLLIPLLDALGRPLRRGLWLHNLGLAGMAIGIALLAGGATGAPWLVVLAPYGYVVAAIGAVPLVIAAALWALPAPLAARDPSPVQVAIEPDS